MIIKKILLLYTGGTIGMDYTSDGLKVVPGLFKSQLDSLVPVANVEIDLIEYEDLIDSSDITLQHWVKIIQDISENYERYDGFIVVHGTDTMAYTASILAFALRGLSKPVILTGAQLPLVHRRSDGWNNLSNAIYSAMQSDLHEVGLVFNHKLFRGCRAQKISTNRFIGFGAVDDEPLAEFGIEISWYKKRWRHSSLFEFLPIKLKKNKILVLSLRPDYTTEFIADTLVSSDVQAVILQTYGCGTIPMRNQHLVHSIESACKKGILITGITQVIEGRMNPAYANGMLDRLGIISGCDMTVEAAFAKLMILLSTEMSMDSIKKSIPISLVGELTETYDR